MKLIPPIVVKILSKDCLPISLVHRVHPVHHSEEKMTAEELEKMAGRKLTSHESALAICTAVGHGHEKCGICEEHKKPRVICGCPKGKEAVHRIVDDKKFVDNRQRVYPIPEIFPEEMGRDWKIYHEASDPRVDMEKKIIHAPLSNDPISHCLKMQQIGRVKWHEDKPIGDLADSMLFRAVEDARISCLLNRAGIDLSAGYVPPDVAVKLGAFIALAGETALLSLLLMSDYTDFGQNLVNAYADNKKVTKAFHEAHQRLEEDPSMGNSINVAKWLRGIFRDMSSEDFDKGTGKEKNRRMKGAKGKGKGPIHWLGWAFPDMEDFFEEAWDELEEDQMLQEIPSAVREQLPKDMPPELRAMLDGTVGRVNLVPWGNMGLEEPPRIKQVFGKFHRRWKATEEGVLPRYPHRFYLDQKVFARRYKLPGGTVVIDASGSMSLRPEQIQSIIDHAPGCTVAAYSGTGLNGALRILAKNGMRVDEKWCHSPMGHGNIVDFPALKWAYKQPHPRVWVSDYVVTGIQDQPGAGNIAMCAAAIKKGRFYVANNVDGAIQVLKRLGRYYRIAK